MISLHLILEGLQSFVLYTCACTHTVCERQTQRGGGAEGATHTGVQPLGISFERQPGDSYRYQGRGISPPVRQSDLQRCK